MKKLLLNILFFAAVVCTSAYPISEHYSLSKSMRALGMGNTFYGLSDDEFALFYNPAGLSLYRGSWQLALPIHLQVGQNAISKFSTIQDAFSNSNDVSQVASQLESLQGDPFSMGVGLMPFFHKKNFAIGLLLGDTKANFSIIGSGVDTELRLTALSDSGLFIGYGREVYPNLHVGVTAKAIVRAGGYKTYSTLEIAQNSSFDIELDEIGGAGGGIDLDVGAIYDLPGVLPGAISHRFALTFTNLLATSFPIAKQNTPPQLPRYVSLGTATIFKGIGPINNFTLLIDFAEFGLGGQSDPFLGARGGSFWKHVNIGLEVPIFRMLAIRTGFRQGNITAGLGIDLKYFKLDVAYWAEELNSNVDSFTERRIGLRMVFGAGDLYKPLTAEAVKRREKRRPKVKKAREEVEKNPALLESKPTTPLKDKIKEKAPDTSSAEEAKPKKP